MRTWWTTLSSELLKYSRMRTVLVLLLGLPLLLILILGSAFDDTIKPAKVALYVEDEGELGQGAAEFWQGDDLEPFVRVMEVSSAQEVQDQVEQGGADYGIYVPSAFTQLVMTGEPAVWHTYSGRYGDKNLAADTIVDQYMTQLNTQLTARRMIGEQAGAGWSAGDRDAELLRIGTLGGGDHVVFGATSAMQYYAATYLIMFLMYGGMNAAMSLLSQKEDGTLRRLYALPAPFNLVVLGIVSGAIVFAMMQAVVIVGFTTFMYGVEWGSRLGWVALVCLLTTLAGSGLAIVVASIVRTRKTTQTIFSLLTIVMTFVSGGMVGGIENRLGPVSLGTINLWANEALRAMMSGASAAAFGQEVAILGAIAALMVAAAWIRLPKVVNQHG